MDTTTKIWPAKSEMATGWTARYPRPTAEGGHHPATLMFKQKTWDEAEARRVRIATRSAEIHAEKAATLQQERDRRQAEIEATRRRQNEETEALLRRRFLAAGGSEDEWTRERESIAGEHRRRQVAHAEAQDEVVRAGSASRYRGL
jgi:hypothetical protein